MGDGEFDRHHREANERLARNAAKAAAACAAVLAVVEEARRRGHPVSLVRMDDRATPWTVDLELRVAGGAGRIRIDVDVVSFGAFALHHPREAGRIRTEIAKLIGQRLAAAGVDRSRPAPARNVAEEAVALWSALRAGSGIEPGADGMPQALREALAGEMSAARAGARLRDGLCARGRGGQDRRRRTFRGPAGAPRRPSRRRLDPRAWPASRAVA